MAHKRKTVRQLADEAQIGGDEALLALWDVGVDYVVGENDFLRQRDVNRARRSLGVATRRELRSVAYWISLLDMDKLEFRRLLQELAIPMGDNIQRFPPKALSRLKAEALRRGIDPITGLVRQSESPSELEKLPSFQWKTVGHERELRYLGEDEIRAIHFQLVDDFASGPDPIDPPGVRTEALLGSAAFRPKTSMGDTLKYPTVEMAAAALLHSIIHDHPFHNGNKRTALVCTLVFLDANGIFPDFREDEAFKLVLQVAQHRIVDAHPRQLADAEVIAVSEWLDHRCRAVEKGNRPLTFRKLRQILVNCGCTVETTAAGKANISRIERTGSIFKKQQSLHIRVSYAGEGREVARSTITKIRQALHLDDMHGIDSHGFYEDQESLDAAGFICLYRKTLRRLGKF